MPTANRSKVTKHVRPYGFSDWFWPFLFRTFGYTPKFLGRRYSHGRFFNYYVNLKTNRKYHQDRETGHIWEIIE